MFDYSFQILTKHQPWILGGILREVIPYCPGSIIVNEHFSLRRERLKKLTIKKKEIKVGQINILVHHQILDKFPEKLLLNQRYKSRILLTHFDPPETLPSKLINKLGCFEKILVQNSVVKSQLLASGKIEKSSKVEVWYGAVDRETYYPADTPKRDYVLIVGDCKPRKNPRLLAEIVATNLDLNFVIHGKGWLNDTNIKKVMNQKNLQIVPFNLGFNPTLMRNASVLLSPSTLEGGPFPVLESLASGTPVVATATGFCREIIGNDKGECVPLGSDASSVSSAIHRTIETFNETSRIDLLNGRFSWQELATKLFNN